MTNERPALGGMLEQLVGLGALEFRPEPLDALDRDDVDGPGDRVDER